MPELMELNLPQDPGGCVDQAVEDADDGWFEPVLPPERPAPKPTPKPKRSLGDLCDDILRKSGHTIPPRPQPEEPEEPEPEPEPVQPPPRFATAPQLLAWIKSVLLARTPLSDDEAELIAYWTISTWLQPSLTILPGLVITGPAHQAYRVLHVLTDLCCRAALVAGFERSQLEALRAELTYLIAEPKLDSRTANLLSSLTDKKFLTVAGSNLLRNATSIAIYAGENPEPPAIQHAIRLHLTPANARPSTLSAQLAKEMIDGIPVHLRQYRERKLSQVEHSTWDPSGLSSEMAIIATELGRCIVGAPELQQKLVGLLKSQDRERLADWSNRSEAVVLEATLNLYHQGKPEFLAGEIATEANRLQKARGELLTYRAENIGHLLKKVGLHTRRTSAGMRLVMNPATIEQVHKLAAIYGGAGLEEDKNQHCSWCAANSQLM